MTHFSGAYWSIPTPSFFSLLCSAFSGISKNANTYTYTHTVHSQQPIMSGAVGISQDALALMLYNILNLTDNQARREVEASVMSALSDPPTVTHLFRIMSNLTGQYSDGTRHLAAVLLRKRLFSLWRSLQPAEQAEVRGTLMEQLGKETNRAVRFAVAHIVTRLAKADAERGGGGWPELQQAIRVAAEDTRVEMRELSMVLIYSFAEVFMEENAMADLAAESVVRGVMDSEEVVVKAALKAGMMLLPCIHEREALRNTFLQHLVPVLLSQLVALSTMKNKGSLCVAFLDLLDQCLVPMTVKKHSGLLESIGSSLLEVMINQASHPLARQNCGVVIGQLVSLKPKFTVNSGLIQHVVKAAAQLMAEDAVIGLPETDLAPEDDEMDDEDVDMLTVRTPCVVGCLLLSALAKHVPSKVYTEVVLPLITSWSEPSQSPLCKKAAMLALACFAESNPSFLRKRVGYVLDLTASFLRDSDPVPREAAGASVTWFCIHLQPEIISHHLKLMDLLIPMLNDESDVVRRRVAQALDTLCEHLQEDLEPYAIAVVDTVVRALPSSSVLTQKDLCAVLSSVAATKCDAVVKMAPKILELLTSAVSMTDPSQIPLRARATETVGVVAVAMGMPAFAPYCDVFIPHVVENFQSDNPVLREYSFGFLSNLCEVLREGFLPYLDGAVESAVQTIEEDRAIYTNQHLLAGQPEMNFQVEDDGADSGAEEEAEEIHMRVRTADVEEKSAAVYSIGVFAETLMEQFGAERLQLCWNLLGQLDCQYYPNIQSNAFLSMAKLTKAAHGSAPVIQELSANTLAAPVRSLVDDLLYQVLLPCISQETEGEVVAAALDAITLMLEFFGPQCLSFGPDDVVRVCLQLFRVKLPCQLGEGNNSDSDEEEEEDDPFDIANGQQQQGGEGEDHNVAWVTQLNPQVLLEGVELPDNHDDVVMDPMTTTLEALFKVYGAQAARFAPFVFPLLLLYADPSNRPAEDLVMAVGTYASLLESLGSQATAPLFEEGFRLAIAVVQQSDDTAAQSNAAYLLHVLIQQAPERFAAAPDMLTSTLQTLWSITAGEEDAGEMPEAVDNAVSATCSLVQRLPPQSLPLEAIVPSLLTKVPMRVDKRENHNAIVTLVHLMTVLGSVSVEAGWTPALLTAAQRCLEARGVENDDKRLLVTGGLMVLMREAGGAWNSAASPALKELMGPYMA